VILATLVFQGLTLPFIIRRLGVEEDRTTDDEERAARLQANRAALARLDQFVAKNKFPPGLVDRLRSEYVERIEQLELCASNPDDCRGEIATPRYQQLQQRALDVERETIIRLRNQRVINDDALRRIQRDLDLAEARLASA
jgi:CPA1 family monovalent cation:H+ antiporter